MLRGGVQSAQNLCFAMADNSGGGGSGRNAKGKKGTGADCKSEAREAFLSSEAGIRCAPFPAFLSSPMLAVSLSYIPSLSPGQIKMTIL